MQVYQISIIFIRYVVGSYQAIDNIWLSSSLIRQLRYSWTWTKSKKIIPNSRICFLLFLLGRGATNTTLIVYILETWPFWRFGHVTLFFKIALVGQPGAIVKSSNSLKVAVIRHKLTVRNVNASRYATSSKAEDIQTGEIWAFELVLFHIPSPREKCDKFLSTINQLAELLWHLFIDHRYECLKFTALTAWISVGLYKTYVSVKIFALWL